jgi:hypothetical protein
MKIEIEFNEMCQMQQKTVFKGKCRELIYTLENKKDLNSAI